MSAGPQPADFEEAGGCGGSPGENRRLSVAAVEALHVEHARDLEAFLWGVLRDRELAAEALQNTFQKVLETGHTAREESVRGWLFKVAFHEGMLLKRKAATQQRALQNLGLQSSAATADTPATDLVRTEDIARLRAALNELPAEQRDVVERRIYREQTFAEIAAELNLPLGTVLTRMRLATEKLQRRLRSQE